jgi:tetratricopeptide (TPR) repeat protein
MKKVPEVTIKTTTGVDKVSGEGLKKGNALYKEGKYSEALPYFEGFLKKNPNQFKMGINLGNCYMQLKQYQKAIKTFKMVVEGFKKETPNLKDNEKAATLYAGIGEAYGALDNLDEAAVYYKKSMELFPPRDAAVAYNIAEIMFNGGKTDEAISYYSLAAKLKPEMAIYYQKLGYAYLNKGDFPQAIANFEKFVKLAPDDPQTPTLQSLIEDLKKQ